VLSVCGCREAREYRAGGERDGGSTEGVHETDSDVVGRFCIRYGVVPRCGNSMTGLHARTGSSASLGVLDAPREVLQLAPSSCAWRR